MNVCRLNFSHFEIQWLVFFAAIYSFAGLYKPFGETCTVFLTFVDSFALLRVENNDSGDRSDTILPGQIALVSTVNCSKFDV